MASPPSRHPSHGRSPSSAENERNQNASARTPPSSCAVVYTAVDYSLRFVWDLEKSAANRLLRGFDFEFATLVFDGPTLERDDLRRDYGERRVITIGIADGLAVTVVYTDRAGSDGEIVRRIISARPSNRYERKAFSEAGSPA